MYFFIFENFKLNLIKINRTSHFEYKIQLLKKITRNMIDNDSYKINFKLYVFLFINKLQFFLFFIKSLWIYKIRKTYQFLKISLKFLYIILMQNWLIFYNNIFFEY